MPVQPDKKYTATVVTALLAESKEKGTPSVFIKFSTEDGTIDHDIWITENTIERASKDLMTLGASAEGMKSWEYLNAIGDHIQGATCEITTVDEPYKGKPHVKVKWINSVRRAASANLAGRVAQLFGGPAAPEPVSNNRQSIDDSDVPF